MVLSIYSKLFEFGELVTLYFLFLFFFFSFSFFVCVCVLVFGVPCSSFVGLVDELVFGVLGFFFF
jgi:hypothetical protein